MNMPCSCAGFACESGEGSPLAALQECGAAPLQERGRLHLFHCGRRLEYLARRCRGGVLDGDDRAEARLRLLVEHVDQLEPSKGQGDWKQHEESADQRVVLQDVPGRARTL